MAFENGRGKKSEVFLNTHHLPRAACGSGEAADAVLTDSSMLRCAPVLARLCLVG